MLKELEVYINENLSNEITLHRISKFAGYSEFHYHRLVKKDLGVTFKKYIIRRRLNLAAYYLIFTELPISSIKELVGYTDSSSFSRSFKKTMHHSPEEFRNLNIREYLFSRYSSPDADMQYAIVYRPPVETLVFPNRGNYFDKKIYSVWKDVEAYLEKQSFDKNQFEYYGIYNDYPGSGQGNDCSYEAAVSSQIYSQNIEVAFFKRHLEGGKFVCYTINTEVADFKKEITRAYHHLQKVLGLNLRAGLPFVKYISSPFNDISGKATLEIYLPVH
jgi:AraC-like DNA-binding protein/DNA gyrase inhibitor GyrI